MKTIALLMFWSLVVVIFGKEVAVERSDVATMSKLKLSLRNKETKDTESNGLLGYVTMFTSLFKFRELHLQSDHSDDYEYDNYTEDYETYELYEYDNASASYEYDNYTYEYGYEYDNISYEYGYEYDNISHEYGYEYDNISYEYGYEYDYDVNGSYEYGYESYDYDNFTYEYGYEYDNFTYEYGYEYDNATYEYGGYEYDNFTYEYAYENGYEYDGNVTNSPTMEKPHCDGEKFYCNNFWSYDNGYSGIGLPCADFSNGLCADAATWSSWRCCSGDLGIKTLDEWKDFCENKGLEVCLRA